MLLSFSCQNFKSFNKEAKLSLIPETRLTELKYSILHQKIGKKPLKSPKNAAKTYQIVQNYIDEYIGKHHETKVDFIHDEQSLIDVANKNPDSVAIIMPALGKGDIFEFVAKDMVLPRKSFSMGHANEKRYYLEAKRIK